MKRAASYFCQIDKQQVGARRTMEIQALFDYRVKGNGLFCKERERKKEEYQLENSTY